VTYVAAGSFKTEWNPDGPLTKEAFAFEQARINEYYDAFVDGVAKGRGVTAARAKKDFGQGRSLSAAACVEAGMADRVAPFAQVLAEMNAAAKPATARGGSGLRQGQKIALLRKKLASRGPRPSQVGRGQNLSAPSRLATRATGADAIGHVG